MSAEFQETDRIYRVTSEFLEREYAFMGDISPHFSKDEFTCKCGCGQNWIKASLIVALEQLRMLGPEPIFILSGYRCNQDNAAVGGVGHSQHKEGTAADLRIIGLNLQQMYDRAKRVPEFLNGGIGVYPGDSFIHLDVRGSEARWARIRGKYVEFAESRLSV